MSEVSLLYIGVTVIAAVTTKRHGKSVFFLYGTGDLAGLDMDGKILWQKNIVKDYGMFSIQWGYGNSPLLFKDKRRSMDTVRLRVVRAIR